MATKLFIRRAVISLIFLSLVYSPEIAGAQVEKRVVFPKGKTSVTFKGRLPGTYADYDAYVLRGRKGKTLSVKLTSADPDARITIYETLELGPMEDAIMGDVGPTREWSGKLPITSEYSVQVYGPATIDDTGSRAAYTIEISLR